MTKIQRIRNIFVGIIMILCGIAMIKLPQYGYLFVAAILSVSLTIRGIRYLVYYFTMARYMVGGKMILYVGIFYLDLGMFTSTIVDEARGYIILYLLICHVGAGLIDVLRGLEARSGGDPHWSVKVYTGIGNVLIAVACLFFFRSNQILVCIYSAGLIYNACVRIFSAFRRTAIVYIP